MKLLNLLDHLRGKGGLSASRHGTDEGAVRAPHALELQATKVLSQLGTIARSYSLHLWSKDEKWKYENDFAIMLAHEDLESVRLELLNSRSSFPAAGQPGRFSITVLESRSRLSTGAQSPNTASSCSSTGKWIPIGTCSKSTGVPQRRFKNALATPSHPNTPEQSPVDVNKLAFTSHPKCASA
jgi:hypothetical protein